MGLFAALLAGTVLAGASAKSNYDVKKNGTRTRGTVLAGV